MRMYAIQKNTALCMQVCIATLQLKSRSVIKHHQVQFVAQQLQRTMMEEFFILVEFKDGSKDANFSTDYSSKPL